MIVHNKQKTMLKQRRVMAVISIQRMEKTNATTKHIHTHTHTQSAQSIKQMIQMAYRE